MALRTLWRGVAPRSSLLLVVVALGCAAPVAPSNPSWDTDVLPIIRGSCGHCHGETTPTTAPPNWRFDLCNTADFGDAASVLPSGALGAAAFASIMVAVVTATPGGSLPRMPPSPAAPLSDYEIDVLKNWAGISGGAAALCKKQAANHEPKAVLVGSVSKDGSTLKATIEVSDPDGDQVLGIATAGGGSAKIPSVGRREIAIANSSGDHITVKLWDGYSSAREITLP